MEIVSKIGWIGHDEVERPWHIGENVAANDLDGAQFRESRVDARESQSRFVHVSEDDLVGGARGDDSTRAAAASNVDDTAGADVWFSVLPKSNRTAKLPCPRTPPFVLDPYATSTNLMALKLLARDDRRRPQDFDDLCSLLRESSQSDRTDARQAVLAIEARGYHRERKLAASLEEFFREAEKDA